MPGVVDEGSVREAPNDARQTSRGMRYDVDTAAVRNHPPKLIRIERDGGLLIGILQ